MLEATSSDNSINKISDAIMPWLVCFIASLFFFYEFVQMNMLNAISPYLLKAFDLNAIQLGKLSSTYFISTVIFLFPAGIILDRFSTRKIILTGLAICILGTLWFALSTSAWMAGISRFFTGIGSAFCFLSCVRLASRWFPAYRLALIIGLIVTMAMVGGMIAQTPFTLLAEHYGWRQTLLIDAVVGVIIFILIAIIVRDYPAHYREMHLQEHQQLRAIGYWKSMRLAFLKVQNWLCGIYTCLLNLPIYLLGGIWGILYLQNVQHISQSDASLITSMLFLGTIIGSPIVGWFSDYIRRRRLPMVICAILSLAVILLIMFIQHLTFLDLMFLFFALGFVTSTQIISYPTVAESNLKILTATSVSVVSISCLSGGAIFEPVFGWLMHEHWHAFKGVMVNGNPFFALATTNLPCGYFLLYSLWA